MADRVAILRRGLIQDVGTPTQVYSRPATLYVAAFLGSPRMNLLEASIYVHLDRYIALHLGDQALYLPWNDMRARQVSHFHGERIVVGVRAEALTPVAPDAPGDVLHGRIRFLEHHGHESLAFVDVGAFAVPIEDAYPGKAAPVAESRLSRVASRFRRTEPAAAHSATAVLDNASGQHRARAEVVVRMPPYPGVRVGDSLAVGVRMDQLHFFDSQGRRIDVGRR
jgi:multiple sugar transport system ATP-binding protein